MASIQYVVTATDAASAVFARIGASADGLDKQLEDLSKRVATPEVDLKDAKFTLGMVNAAKRLDKLSAMVANPEVEVDTAKAQLEILRINGMLDRLDAKKVDVSVNVQQGVLSRLGGLLGGGGGGGGGSAGGAGSAAGGGGGLASSLANPGGIAGAVAAALAALPFLAQGVAGGIVTALGGGLTAVGVIAAFRLNKVKESFKDLTTSANANLHQIGLSFAPAMESIFRHVSLLFGTLVPVIKSLAAPFKIFSDALLNAFMQPAVTRSLQAVATAFGDILKALAPQLAGDIGAIAAGITNIAAAVSSNPKAFADFISFLFKIAGGALDIISSLTRVANWIEAHWNVVKWIAVPVIAAVVEVVKNWNTLQHETAVIFDGIRHDIAAIWDLIFENSVGMVIRLVHNVETQFDSLRHSIAATWDMIWRTTITQAQNGINGVVGWFQKLPGRALGALFGFGHSLYAFAHAALDDFLSGLQSVGGTVLSWLRNFIGGIPHDIMSFLHMSPPHAGSAFFDLGANIMHHFEAGIQSTAHRAVSAARKAVASAGGGHAGPGGGAPSANAALAHRLYASQLTPASWEAWNAVAMAESGWNQFARNPSSGAYGIAQALPPTKYPPAGQAAGGSNPTAQITWMWDYMMSRYGGPLGAEAHEAAFHWYDQGGWLPPGLSLALNTTGAPERVGGGSGVTIGNLTITLPPGSDKEQGRRIVSYIRSFEKGSGAGWRGA